MQVGLHTDPLMVTTHSPASMQSTTNLPAIAHNLQLIRRRIDAAAHQAGRSADTVRLLAVSKTFGAADVAAAANAGQHCFGENYVQEALEKITTLRQQGFSALEWHCIGPLQSRKTAAVAQHFDWLHSLHRADIAQRLARQRPSELPPLNVCIQVNMDDSSTKAGIAPTQVTDFARQILELPTLRLRGLMSIPDACTDSARTLAIHQRTRALFDTVGAQLGLPGSQWDTLSMGMSADLEEAIAAGSTLVRVGSAIFGQRSYSAPSATSSADMASA